MLWKIPNSLHDSFTWIKQSNGVIQTKSAEPHGIHACLAAM
jgi:hypothetical protein